MNDKKCAVSSSTDLGITAPTLPMETDEALSAFAKAICPPDSTPDSPYPCSSKRLCLWGYSRSDGTVSSIHCFGAPADTQVSRRILEVTGPRSATALIPQPSLASNPSLQSCQARNKAQHRSNARRHDNVLCSGLRSGMRCLWAVRGPSVDPKLVRFAADLDWVKNQGVTVARFNLAQQPGDFAVDSDVKAALEDSIDESLPLIKVDGAVKSKGRYPRRAELAAWVGLEAPDEPTARFTRIASGPCCSANASGKDSPCC